MVKVKQKYANETFDSMFRRFKKAVENADIVKDYRKHEFFEQPSAKRKREAAAAIKREMKRKDKSSVPPKQLR